jgi:hypothetical protein
MPTNRLPTKTSPSNIEAAMAAAGSSQAGDITPPHWRAAKSRVGSQLILRIWGRTGQVFTADGGITAV